MDRLTNLQIPWGFVVYLFVAGPIVGAFGGALVRTGGKGRAAPIGTVAGIIISFLSYRLFGSSLRPLTIVGVHGVLLFPFIIFAMIGDNRNDTGIGHTLGIVFYLAHLVSMLLIKFVVMT